MGLRTAGIKDDCFAHFDEAFASLEAALDGVPVRTETVSMPHAPATTPSLHLVTTQRVEVELARHSSPPPPALAEYEEAFSLLDATMARRGTTPNMSPPPAARAVAARRPSASTTPASAPSTAPATIDRALWRQRSDGGTPLERLFVTLQNLSLIQDGINMRGTRDAERFTRDSVRQVFAEVRELCTEFDLQTARVRADFALAALQDEALETLGSEVTELVRHIRHDLQSCSIWPIARDRVWSFSLALGDKAEIAFPSAPFDMAEGGRCYGFGRYSACVFHMLRAAEQGVRALARAADAKRAAAHEGPDWAPLLALVDARVSEIGRWPAGPAKAKALAFFQSSLSDARAIQDAARRLASGATGAAIEEHQALQICTTTKDLLVRLSERLTESHRRTLGMQDFLR